MGKVLTENTWLPNKEGINFAPSEITMDDLPEGFIHDETLAKKLGMKWNALQNLAKEAGYNEEDANDMEEFLRFKREDPEGFAEFKLTMAARKERPTFPKRPVANPERRQERLGEQLSGSSVKEYEKRERSVRITDGTIEPATWLRNQYTNEADQMVCQICKEEMPFRKRDGLYYFEKKEVLSRKFLQKEIDAQYLALCPLCAAKYEEFIKSDEDVMDELKDAIVSAKDYEISISLGNEKTSIRFVETHLLDLKTILDSGE